MDLAPSRRRASADDVLEQLAREILDGVPAPGEPLESERALAERLGVSRVIVRAAIHQLADMGLCEVRQGAATRVRDPSETMDMRLVELIYRLGARLPRALARAMIERQYLNGASLVELASLRDDVERLRSLHAETRDAGARARTLAEHDALERAFWSGLAAATHNPILAAELRWWYRIVGERMPRPRSVRETPLPVRVAFLVELARRCASRDEPLAYYHAVVRPLLLEL